MRRQVRLDSPRAHTEGQQVILCTQLLGQRHAHQEVSRLGLSIGLPIVVQLAGLEVRVGKAHWRHVVALSADVDNARRGALVQLAHDKVDKEEGVLHQLL